MSNSLSRRNRRSTGENIQGERTLTQSARRSLPMVNLKEVLVTAKMKFESEQDENSVSSVPVNSEELKRKASSAPASPGKSLTVSVPNPCDNVGSTTRSRLLRSDKDGEAFRTLVESLIQMTTFISRIFLKSVELQFEVSS
mgnify:FL=1